MRRLLYSIGFILVVMTGCASNDYDYLGKEILWTPYDGQYRRVEEYLQRQYPTEVANQRSTAPVFPSAPVILALPANPFSPPAPVILAPPAKIDRP